MSAAIDLANRSRMPKQGVLYIVATPIGNMADITLRAIQILDEVNLIAAEDTRRTQRLLAYHKIKNRLISFHEHNEVSRTKELLKKMAAGQSIALVSNAGTPTLSDPGYRLVKKAIEHYIHITPIPGVSAAITALSASGLPTDAFVFLGFLSRKKGKRHLQLNRLRSERKTIIIYESPKRITALLKDIIYIMGNRQGVLAREMTKRHEEFIHGRISFIAETLEGRPQIKGECTLLIAGNMDAKPPMAIVRKELQKGLRQGQSPVSKLAKEVASRYGLSKRQVYDEALRLKKADHEAN